ncbi:MAG: leucine-rich repeat protein [Paludibacteraceae bacterium]
MKEDKYGVQYSDDGKVLLKIPTELEGEFVIPDGVEELNLSFLYRPEDMKLSSLKISKTVTDIGNWNVFYGLDSLSVDPDNPKYDSRDNCNAIIETSSNTLLYASKHAFIPDGTKRIHADAFDGFCDSKIFIPSSVEYIDDKAFLETSFSSIEVDAANKFYDSRDNCNAIIDSRSNTLILGSSHTSIPLGVESIGEGAFENCPGIQRLVIPESVYSLKEGAFCSAEIGELYISKSVERIDPTAFGNCIIRKIYLDENNTTFYEKGNCLITKDTARLRIAGKNFTIPHEVKIIGSCSLTLSEDALLEIPNGVVEIMSGAITVKGVRLRLVLPSSVKLIMEQFLSEKDIEEIVVPAGQKERFSRMDGLEDFSHLIIEADE